MKPSFLIDEQVFFQSRRLRIEGILSYRGDISSGDRVLILSPHPHFAGDMNNNVVRALAAALALSGRIVFRFNYHGVGESEAPPLDDESIFDYWRRVEEERDYTRALDDWRAAHEFLHLVAPGRNRVVIVGYSFGALLAALGAPGYDALDGLVLISAPFGKMKTSEIEDPRCPVLVLGGEKDFVFDRSARDAAVARLGKRVTVETMSGSDHFFRGEEQIVVKKALRFLGEIFVAESTSG